MRKMLVAALLVGLLFVTGCTLPSSSHVKLNATYPSILNPYPTIEFEATVLK